MSLPKFREPAELQTFYINHSCHKTSSRRSLTALIQGPRCRHRSSIAQSSVAASTGLETEESIPAAYHSIPVCGHVVIMRLYLAS